MDERKGARKAEVDCKGGLMDNAKRLVGTPIEIQELVRAFFSGVINGVEGHSMTLDKNGRLRRTKKTSRMVGIAERTVWEVEIRPMDGLAPKKCRDALEGRCARLELVNQLYDIMEKNSYDDNNNEVE